MVIPMAFMARNRSLNAGDVSAEVAAQRAQETLLPNDTALGSPQKRTFEPDLMTIEGIVAARRRGIDNPSGFSDYNGHIPYGPQLPGETEPLP